jgi:soluble lytic murein transglycosylase-like protein
MTTNAALSNAASTACAIVTRLTIVFDTDDSALFLPISIAGPEIAISVVNAKQMTHIAAKREVQAIAHEAFDAGLHFDSEDDDDSSPPRQRLMRSALAMMRI